MSRGSITKKKKSTSKYRSFKISPLIPIVAIIEVFVLIGASTYAWLVFSANKTAKTGVITVDADSGLDIDFKYANTSDTINIWNYIDDDFAFEPASSIDGRNIFFPTSGSFPSLDSSDTLQMTTNDIKFREGTVNDINSKYLSIDFELTNTDTETMDVYLKNSSEFRVKHNNSYVDSKALRLGFYPNDGSKGNVRSNMFGDSGAADSGTNKDLVTIYYDNWNHTGVTPYVYVWNSASEGSNSTENKYTEIAAYPGSPMTHVGDSIYSFTLNKNYDMCIFNNGQSGDGNKYTGDLYVIDDQIYEGSQYTSLVKSDGVYTKSKADFITDYSDVRFKFSQQCSTVYFTKPSTSSWSNGAYAYIWDDNANPKLPYRSWPGTQMSLVGADVYSLTYYNPSSRVVGDISTYNKIVFNNGYQVSEQDSSKKKKSNDTDLANVANRLYYFKSGDSGAMNYTSYDSTPNTIYFYNTHGWSRPYIKATFGSSKQDVALASLTGNVYYCTLPSVYTSVYFYDKATNARTVDVPSGSLSIQNGYIYRPTNRRTGSNYQMDSFSYDNYTTNGSYAVISPGVSAGFQRSYNPVVSIDNETGAATQFVPAFSDSIDNYIYGSDNPMFVIEPYHMISLSMIVWLEGTDEDCDNKYSLNDIDLKLEFTTVKHTSGLVYNNSESPNYKYRFVDETRELWTSDRLSTESGVTVAPVMQLYDIDNSRGYLMKAASYSDYKGKSKVKVWECYAPKSIAANHLQFRRVNPYNESEIWNYWDCDKLKNGDTVLYPNAITLGPDEEEADDNHQKKYVNICTFTAFADGAPAKTFNDYGEYFTGVDNWNAGSSANAPDLSCGGLWGKFTTTTLTMVDGTGGQEIKNSTTNSSALTINYTYKYSNGQTKNIEYKASGPEKNTGFFFVIPTEILRSASNLAANTNITFKKYDNFNGGFAMNIPKRNPSISYVKTYTFTDVSKGVRGPFGYIADTAGTYNYWGSDVVYIQCQNHMKDTGFNNKTVRLRFFASTESSNDKITQIFYNSNYNTSGGTNNSTLGYACVIPCNRQYNSFQIQQAEGIGSTDTVNYNSYSINIDTHSLIIEGCYNNAVTNNIYTCNYIKQRVYYMRYNKDNNYTDWGNEYGAPVQVHYWNSSTGMNSTVKMSNSSYNFDNKPCYYADIPISTTMQFYTKSKTSKDITPEDGHIYYPNNYDNSDGKFWCGNVYKGDGSGIGGNDSIDITVNNSPDWM